MSETAVLTGASRGLGSHLLQELLAREIRVIAVGRNTQALRGAGGDDRLALLEFDLGAAGDPAAGAALAQALGDRLDAAAGCSRLTFIGNAGAVEPIGPSSTLEAAALLQAIAVNFAAPALLSVACARWAARMAVPFRVLNVSSGAASRPLGGWAAYCSTKAAARMFHAVQGIEGCDVVQIDPGVLDTGMQATIREADPADFPDVARFRELERSGALRDPRAVAREIVAAHYPAAPQGGSTR
jgi:NAD(P)-dependent dehydrogenase (short-subunit alcohol dehydrogenase family)